MKVSSIQKLGISFLIAAICFQAAPSFAQRSGDIDWAVGAIRLTMAPGEQLTQTVTFTTRRRLAGVRIRPVGEIANVMSVQPSSFFSVIPGRPQRVTLSFSVPANFTERTITGQLRLLSQGGVTDSTLEVAVDVKNSVLQAVTLGGGTVFLPGKAAVQFPQGAFSVLQFVELAATSSPETAQDFEESAAIFRPGTRLSYEIRVNTGSVRPQEPAQVTFYLPADFLDSTPPGSDAYVFAQIWEDGGEELLDNFELIDSVYDPVTHSVQATLPKEAFTDKRRDDHQFEAVVTVASVPGAGSISPAPQPVKRNDDTSAGGLGPVVSRPKALSNRAVEKAIFSGAPINMTGLALDQPKSTCEGVSLGPPLEGTIEERRPFNRADEIHPITHSPSPHYGTDLRAAGGSSVLAVATGKIVITGFQYNTKTGTGWGNYMVLRHDDGSATLYAHLMQGSLLPAGQRVDKGQQIAQSDTSGGAKGPHLHLEYAPNGQIFDKPSKVDPFPCIGDNVSTSISVGDNGTAADDAFEVYIDGLFLGQTAIGSTNTIAAGNLRRGRHLLRIVCVVAPDDVGTLGVTLSDGVTFADGTTTRSEVLTLNGEVDYEIIVPSQ